MEEAIKILAERPQNYFIDIGCGKGKPCIYAKKYFKFKQIIGIDFSKPLIDTANKNLKNTQYTNIVFTVADGVEWKLPDEFCVVFLHNPFNGIILEKFIVNNLNNFRIYNSIVVYAYDLEKDVLLNLGFETLYRNWKYSIYMFKSNLQISK